MTDYVVRENIVLKELVGEFMLIPVGAAVEEFPAMKGLNESGAFVWSCLAEGLSTAEILSRVTRQYEVDAADAEKPLQRILQEMAELGYIREKHE